MQRDSRAGYRDQCARMEDLRAVVRDFGGLAMMQLRNQPRVGDGPWIGGQDAGHVLPQHDPPGPERARQDRRGEIRSAATERGDAAVRRTPDETGDDHDRAGLQQRRHHGARPHRRLIELRRRAAVLAVGLHDLGRVDARHAPLEAPDGGRQQPGRDTLTASHQRVLAAQSQMSDRIDRRTDVAIFTSGVIDRVRQLAMRLPAAEKVTRRLLMLARERVCGSRR